MSLFIHVTPRLDSSLNFKLGQRPSTYLLVPTGGLQDAFSSVPSSGLTLPSQEVMRCAEGAPRSLLDTSVMDIATFF